MGRFGVTEILLLLVIAVVFFGASRISTIGKGLGEGIRNFKKGLRDDDEPEKLPAKDDDDSASARTGTKESRETSKEAAS